MNRPSLLIALFAAIFFCRPAYAYIDPGSASLALQAVLAIFAGLLVVGGRYWQKIRSFFGAKDQDSHPSDDTADQ